VAEIGGFAWILTTAEGFVATAEDNGLSLLVELEVIGRGLGTWREWVHVPTPGHFDARSTARRLVDRALLTLGPVTAGTGVKDLLLHPEVAAHLLAALAPLFIAPRRGRDPLPGLLNADGELAAQALTLVDTRVDPSAPIIAPCDGEGLPAGRTLLLEAGVPRHRLACFQDAVAAGDPPRGGAVRLSYRDAPVSGIANLAVAVEDGLAPGRLLGATQRALYVLRPLAPVRCDLANDRYRIVASGVWLDNGRVSGWHPVVELGGSLGQLLRRVDAVGADLAWHQTEAGMVGSPSILVRRQPIVG
jgi:PmbA protein